ncbi:hypothetical protein [Spirosoma fluminis]
MIDATTVGAHQHAVGQKKGPCQRMLRVIGGPLERLSSGPANSMRWWMP